MSELFSASSAPPRATPFVGRGACPRRVALLTISPPNPTGHHSLRLDYRLLQSWQTWHVAAPARTPVVLDGSRLHQAEQLALQLFRVIGGFLAADDAVLRAAYDALGQYSYAQLLAAIAAKARSDPQRKFVPRPANFFRAPELWVDKSGVRKAEQARAAADARRDRQLTEREREQAEIDAEYAQLAGDSSAKILFASLLAKAAARFPARRLEPSQRAERDYQVRRAVVYAHRATQMPKLLDDFGRLLPVDGEGALRSLLPKDGPPKDGEDSLRLAEGTR